MRSRTLPNSWVRLMGLVAFACGTLLVTPQTALAGGRGHHGGHSNPNGGGGGFSHGGSYMGGLSSAGFFGGGFFAGGVMGAGIVPFAMLNPGPLFLGPPWAFRGNAGGGMWLPFPGPAPFGMNAQPQQLARPQPAKADGLVTIGDRLFRAKNTKKAAERYEQARRANPKSATPLVRLAQLEIGRGEYAKAADLIREAMITEPGWHVNAADIQGIYAEPADFAKVIAKLETHLQQSPNDRDGWLVLGTQLYLSGKTRQAGDVFRRLSDRKPDLTLAAFLDATSPELPARQ